MEFKEIDGKIYKRVDTNELSREELIDIIDVLIAKINGAVRIPYDQQSTMPFIGGDITCIPKYGTTMPCSMEIGKFSKEELELLENDEYMKQLDRQFGNTISQKIEEGKLLNIEIQMHCKG